MFARFFRWWECLLLSLPLLTAASLPACHEVLPFAGRQAQVADGSAPVPDVETLPDVAIAPGGDMSPPPVDAKPVDAIDGGEPPLNGRVPGPVALYLFDEGSGPQARDSAPGGAPYHLEIVDAADSQWLPGALQLVNSSLLIGSGPASKIISACKASNALTVEAWVAPRDAAQSGPARIVALSKSVHEHDFLLGQGKCGGGATTQICLRVRTTESPDSGGDELETPSGSVEARLTHWVLVRDGAGKARVYRDAVQLLSVALPGSFSNWDDHPLVVGDELLGGRAWVGTLHLIAIYCQALSTAEVKRNFVAGADPELAAP